MSEDLMQSEIDRREHRCRPLRKPKLGAFWRCDCGRRFQYVDTKFGRQWTPIAASMT